MVTIMSGDGSPVYELGITVNSQMSTIVLSLPGKMTSLSVSGTVSVGQLLHPIDKKGCEVFCGVAEVHREGRLRASG
jgi:hypothetical protein